MTKVVLTAGMDRLVIDPAAGGRIASLVAGGVERMVTREQAPAAGLDVFWGCFPMVPWCGRLDGGALPDGQYESWLETNLDGHAIHGLAFSRPWTLRDSGPNRVSMTFRLAGLGWNNGGEAWQTLSLRPGRLDLELGLRGLDRSAPVGVGWHPWFRRPRAGDLRIRVCSAEEVEQDNRLIPTGRILPVRGESDLRGGPPIGERRLNTVYANTSAPAEIWWPDLHLTISFDHTVGTVVVFTPEAGVCVEPQTLWPNAPALARSGVLGTGVTFLSPGEKFVAHSSWTWEAS